MNYENKNIVAIIQARWNSKRFPGKISHLIENKSVINHVIDRMVGTKYIKEVCCALPKRKDSIKIKNLIDNSSVKFFFGDEEDVLKRFYDASIFMKADIIVRVTSDCPINFPVVNEKVIKLLIDNDLDYACNNNPPTFPHGLDCEVFTFNALELCNEKAIENYDREHVTPWLRDSKDIKKLNLFCAEKDVKQFRLTLDYEEDLLLLRKIFYKLKNCKNPIDLESFMKFLKNNKDLFEINQKHTIER